MTWLIEFIANIVIKGLLFGGLLMGLILFGIPLGTWAYVWLIPSRVEGTVQSKMEQVGKHGRGWTVYLWMTVKYSPDPSRGYELATITVDEGTWDQCKAGSRVEIAYFPLAVLRQIPMIYTKRLARPLPPLPLAPDARRSASAAVQEIHHITTARSGRGSSALLLQPYDVVVIRYTPEGRTEPVTVIDSVDAGSLSNLAVGEPVTFTYSMMRPRVVKIAGGRRYYIWKNYDDLLILAGLIALALLLYVVIVHKSRGGAGHANADKESF